MSFLSNLFGGSSSSAVVNALQSTITNIAYNAVQSCDNQVTQNQTTNISGGLLSVGGATNVTQTTSVDFECMQKSGAMTNLQNQVISAISNSSTASGVALLSAFGASKTEATSNLTTLVQNNLSVSNIQNNYNLIRQNQTTNIASSLLNFGSTVNVSQGASVFMSAVQNVMNNSGIYNTIQAKLDQTSTATTSNPLSFLAGLLTAPVLIFCFVFVLIIAAIVLSRFASNGGIGGGCDCDSSKTEPMDLDL